MGVNTMDYLIGLDIGTSGVKGVLITINGDIKASSNSNYEVFNPEPGWAEQDPEDWWHAVLDVLRELNSKSDGTVIGISFSGQMHSAVFLDKNYNVIRPAILWSDTRTNKQCKEIESALKGRENLIVLTGNRALEGFTAPKILWLKENEQNNYEKLKHLLLPKDYIRYRLTGVAAMDYSDGAGTLLMDVKNKKWSRILLNKLDIDKDILPPLVSSTDQVGKVSKEVSQITGLDPGIPVIAGGADNACGAIGSGIIEPERAMVSIGSSGVVLAPSEKYQINSGGKLHLFNHADSKKYYYMGVMLSAGQSLSWVKNKILPNDWSYDIFNKKANNIDPGSEGLIFLPYLYGERTPHADANARGVFFGLSARHQRSHLARSVMEGITFGLKDSLELIKNKEVNLSRIRAIGGGVKSQLWQQILADIFELPIDLLEVEEGPAYGAAIIAGVGVGAYENFKEADNKLINIKKTIEPKESNFEAYQKNYKTYKDLYPALKDIYTYHSKS